MPYDSDRAMRRDRAPPEVSRRASRGGCHSDSEISNRTGLPGRVLFLRSGSRHQSLQEPPYGRACEVAQTPFVTRNNLFPIQVQRPCQVCSDEIRDADYLFRHREIITSLPLRQRGNAWVPARSSRALGSSDVKLKAQRWCQADMGI